MLSKIVNGLMPTPSQILPKTRDRVRSERWGWVAPEVNVTQDRRICISFVWQCFFLFYFHSDLQLELYMFKCHY